MRLKTRWRGLLIHLILVSGAETHAATLCLRSDVNPCRVQFRADEIPESLVIQKALGGFSSRIRYQVKISESGSDLWTSKEETANIYFDLWDEEFRVQRNNDQSEKRFKDKESMLTYLKNYDLGTDLIRKTKSMYRAMGALAILSNRDSDRAHKVRSWIAAGEIIERSDSWLGWATTNIGAQKNKMFNKILEQYLKEGEDGQAWAAQISETQIQDCK